MIASDRRQAVGDAEVSRGASRFAFAVGPRETRKAGRTDRERHCCAIAHHLHLESGMRHVAQHVLVQLQCAQIVAVSFQRHLLVRSVHEIENDPRKSAARQRLEIENAGNLGARAHPTDRSPLPESAPMRSAVRQASAWIVSDGLTPPHVGNRDPSQIHKFRMSKLRPSASTTPVAGSALMRHVPST